MLYYYGTLGAGMERTFDKLADLAGAAKTSVIVRARVEVLLPGVGVEVLCFLASARADVCLPSLECMCCFVAGLLGARTFASRALLWTR